MRLLLLLILSFGLAAPLQAHPGHDEQAPPVAAALPRTEAHSEAFEIVAVLGPGGVLTLWLDRWADNAPVDGAISLTIEGREAAAQRQGIGIFVARHPALAQAGRRDIVFTVTAGDEMDLLTATLDVPTPPGLAGGNASLAEWIQGAPVQIGGGIALLLLGVLLGRGSVRRPLPPMVDQTTTSEPAPSPQPALPRRVAALATASLLVGLGAPAWSETASPASAPAEAPRRLEDGAIFLPKASQRLLAIRTQLAEAGEASAAVRMVGTLVPDPNASGRVQPSQTGRLEPGDQGFPTLGQRVERGQVLAYVTPTYTAAERGGLIQNAAELDAQITILEARVRRLTSLRGTVAEREIQDAQAELAGARQRRTAIQPALSGREPLVAPVAGIVSTVRGAVGQLVDSAVTVFDIVDPSRLWVEALAFDRAAVERVTGATATLADGRVLELGFVGRGLTVRQQAIPMNFRVEAPPADAPIGASVLVTLRTARGVQGLVLPADAVVRSAEGPPVVFEHATAERFLPRQVRVQPLDGSRVVVTAGLEPGRRVVIQGAALIAQVR
ncbi:efflux RND transporter periplasmic adaptor subunit [Roseococcus sp. SDR]|uniref:efflux RND transporter periplasmic adaptor subunit n=1 Tax=Roseococcus sp. SDR TaxID=2835532 RepID=UPI001BCBF432|nr:HlyD family efflux transporter periplasmic adaptor subunit [Roseococcus sp. SDR]MBS7789723.1 efflux RND transporter periplasmic adaptor subunit [Roseococcus sp. SDR]MBV1845037.1 efflux RND transporter periplasmic adaptor subunit [Roseococcus sp. SDR]